ncbi:MAG: Holliday junction resolvase RuvX [Planctomyces sp.]|nr:Holliday junction resolvase RuvX [Planctomyces sp.]
MSAESPFDPPPGTPGSAAPGSAGDIPAAGRLLGIDYGTKRLGFAISTPEQSIASPLENYTRRGPKQDAEALRRVATEYRIVGLIVGLPLHMGGEEGVKAGESRRFAAWAAGILNCPVALQDERCTTAVAEDILRDAGVPRSKWKQRLDKLAAQILLQSFLDSRSRDASSAAE